MIDDIIPISFNDSNKRDLSYLSRISELKKGGIDPEDPNLDPITRVLLGQLAFKYSKWIDKGGPKPNQAVYSSQNYFPKGLNFNQYGLKVIEERGKASPNELQALGMRLSSENNCIVHNRGGRIVRSSVTFILYQYKNKHLFPADNVVNH